jgi:hypothetical protein
MFHVKHITWTFRSRRNGANPRWTAIFGLSWGSVRASPGRAFELPTAAAGTGGKKLRWPLESPAYCASRKSSGAVVKDVDNHVHNFWG